MRDFFHDLAAAFLAGLAASAGLFAALFVAGFLIQSFQPRGGLIYARGGMLITGSLGISWDHLCTRGPSVTKMPLCIT